jgi:hypothetical protein
MQETELRILALNPGSRYAGIAVFHSQELVDWGVRSIREESEKDRSHRLKRFLTEVIERDGINCFTVKGLHPARSSEYLRQLTNELKGWAVKCGLVVREYAIKEIETILPSTSRSNKQLLMEEVAARHPVLYQELEREKKNRNPYLVRMFEAVALGTKCLNDLEESKGRKRISVNHENTKG